MGPLEALGLLAYLFLLFWALKTINFHMKLLKANTTLEGYASEVVHELKALSAAIHVVKAENDNDKRDGA